MHRETSISVVFGLVFAVALLAACGGGGDGPGVAPPAARASATPGIAGGAGRPIASQEAVETVPVPATLVTIGRPLPLPFELALILATGNRLDRIVRTADGDTLQEVLFDPADYGGTVRITYWNIGHIGPVLPPGQLALAVCTAGDCGGHDQASADAAVSLFRSNDGGVTWKASEQLDGAFLITTATASDRLLLKRMTQEGRPSGDHYEWWPSGDVVTPPASSTGPRGSYVLPDGTLLWWGGGGMLVDSQDATVIDLGEQLGPGQSASGTAVLPSADGERLAITWQRSDADAPSDGQRLWSIYERAGTGAEYELTQTFEALAMIPTAWIDRSRLLVNGEFEASTFAEPTRPGPSVRFPSILDLERARLTPIAGPYGEEGIGRGWAVAVEIGPFARVVVGAGDCLNIRLEPSVESERLDCAADGVLLRQNGPEQGGWLPVRTPAGDEGWASVDFLSVLPDQTLLAGK